MTMSGSNHTVPPVPLDLTNKTRECGSCARGTTGDLSRCRHTPQRQVESAHSSGQGFSPPEPRDSFGPSSISQSTQKNDGVVRGNRTLEDPGQTRPNTPNVESTNLMDTGRKLTDWVSKLPIRKRPFPLDQDHTGQRNVHAEQHNEIKEERRGPSLKVFKYSDPGHLGTDAKILTKACVSQSVNDSQFASPFTPCFIGYPYFQWSQQYTSPHKPNAMPVPTLSPPPLPPESTDRLLEDIVAATCQDEDGDTPLHIAVVKENGALVVWLIEIYRQAHRDLDIFNNLRQTPLHLAVITHQPGLVEALLNAGADPGALDRNGQTALHLCCEHGEVDCLSVILRHYSHNSSHHLEIRNYEAVQNGDTKLAKILLDSGAEFNAGDNKSGRSPLIHAVENNSNDMVNLLIESGCDVNAQSYSGNTALHSACGRGQIEIIRILLKNGADSSVKNNHNDTAIMVAKNKKVSDVLRGKGTRSYTVKTLSNSNGSPGSSNHSPRVTPTLQRSSSRSPVAPVSHSPQSHSAESISERQSPMSSNEKTLVQTLPRTCHNIAADNRESYGMTLHTSPYRPPSAYDQIKPSFSHIQRRMLFPGSPLYYGPGIQRPPYYSDAQIIFFPGIPVPLTYGSPSEGTVNQSRPSSRSSDQSDMSSMSVNSEERGVS
ncbi:NF-kappa-B inhibitor cactus-like isoform X2 [Myxocyprinus asiaticus]|uniref:NF-kappa-B inhibitor cactus-like isoform X2 n=1 Tax=Myxocyprinus asiaticus TaxID=70543 RepID=UPI0022237C77|nr:NF-kappa-B inhibitor cactus-like isoform X2 [Myxocyprinus asiaticus]